MRLLQKEKSLSLFLTIECKKAATANIDKKEKKVRKKGRVRRRQSSSLTWKEALPEKRVKTSFGGESWKTRGEARIKQTLTSLSNNNRGGQKGNLW